MKYSDTKTLAKADDLRKKQFKAALRLADLTMVEWCKRERTSQGFVSNLLARRRENEAMNRKIDAFIAKQFSAAARVA